MISFEYAQPRTEGEAVEMLSAHDGQTAILAGGTDLFNLLRRDLIAPRRVVDIKKVDSMQGITSANGGVMIGALVTIGELLEHPLLSGYDSLRQIADAHHAVQIQSTGTLGGDLCHMPNCWYYRNGHSLLGMQEGKSLVAEGRNQFHAVFGNRGPAMFVSASRFAPALIALGAKVRIAGPAPDQAETIPLEYFYVSPKTERQHITVLQPGQFVTHIWIPGAGERDGAGEQQLTAAYEMLQLEGLEWPIASAAVSVKLSAGIVKEANIVLGHVAPTPWLTLDAAAAIVGQAISEETATAAGEAAVANATPLSENDYKVQIAKTCVKRALLKAAGLYS